MSLADNLLQLRTTAGMTQQALADAAKVNVLQIKRYEGGHSEPSVRVLVALANALGCTLDALAYEEGPALRGSRWRALAARVEGLGRPHSERIAEVVLALVERVERMQRERPAR
ncbi:MAG: helix-turn-helix transcriptional regulator [Deltaproteobacteria bacterium]|nr:helix-turn-helix transcriptional regulator [Deltaproteobacteria bacterium]